MSISETKVVARGARKVSVIDTTNKELRDVCKDNHRVLDAHRIL